MVLCIVLLVCYKGYAQNRKERVLYTENFDGKLNKKRWHAEIEPVGESSVYSENGQLLLNTGGGVTVWYTQKLKGNLRIEYDWTVWVGGEKNDRLSDLNQFWMATDPGTSNLFTRNGKFETYDSLALYYVGFGGNTNSTTRFRKYHGNGQKPLLQEYTDAAHLLKPNRKYHIVIVVENGQVTFSVDNEVFFEWSDPAPLCEGYFGFRSTSARHAIDNFQVIRLR